MSAKPREGRLVGAALLIGPATRSAGLQIHAWDAETVPPQAMMSPSPSRVMMRPHAAAMKGK